MKRLLFLVIFAFGLLAVPMMRAQDAILEDISEMNDVEVTYITQRMLQSMGTNNISVGGLNISKIAKELTSLQIVNAEGKSLAKVREKLKAIRKLSGLELIMKMKEDGERTEMYGEKGKNGNYRKLLLLVDERKEIIVVYMKGNIGKNCFDEMTRRTRISSNVQIKDYYIIDAVTVKSNNKSRAKSVQKGSGRDLSLEEIDKQLAEIDQQLNEIEKELAPIEDQINKINDKIRKSKVSERERLYVERAKLFEKRNFVYAKRGNLFLKRGELYVKRSKATVGSIKIDKSLYDVQDLINGNLYLNLEGLKGLKGLEGLKGLQGLKGLEGLNNLDSLKWEICPEGVIMSKK